MRIRLAIALVLVLAVGVPLLCWLSTPEEALLGWCGVGRGEFENWAFTDWWVPQAARCHMEANTGAPLTGLWGVLGIPRDLEIGNYLDGVLIALPLKALLGPLRGHNARVAMVLSLNAAAAFWACLQAARTAQQDDDRAEALGTPTSPPVLASPVPTDAAVAAAVVCAVALACNPITLWDVAESRFAQALIAPLVLYLGAMLRWMRAPSWQTAALAGVALALTALDYWYAAILVLPVALMMVACRRDALGGGLLHAALGAALCLPFALPLLASDAGRTPWGTPFPALEQLRIPARGVLGPPGPGLTVAQSIDLAVPLAPPLGPSLPVLLVVCAMLALPAWRRRPGAAAAICTGATLWWAFALGPFVRFHGEVIAPGLVHALSYRWVPFLWRLYWPARTLPMVAAVLALLCAPGLTWLLERLPSGARRTLTTAALAAAALLSPASQGLLPLPISTPRIPAPYREGLLGNTRDGVVELSLPVNASSAVWYQTWHEHPLLGGQAFCPHRDTTTPGWARDPRALNDDPLMRWAGAVRSGETAAAPPTDAVRRMRDAGFPWLVVQRTYGERPVEGAEALVKALTETLGQPALQSSEMCAWHLGTNR